MRLIIASLLVLSLSTSVFATAPEENPIVTLEKVGQNKFQLKYMGIPEGRITVAFKNEDNRVIFRDVIEAEKVFFKNYDLNKLDLGNYQIEVFTAESGKLEDFDVYLGPKSVEKSYFAKVQVLDNKTLAFILKNLDGSEKKLEIFDNGKLVFEEPIVGDTFGKKFKFEKIGTLENISFKVSDKNGFGNYISAL
ncbi:hypothetical protein SAMN04488057_105351 [Cyclobacterium lianum]|uniref:Por secretion system C-terminal sorting domain-containing protein n=1 Tax=Cyclobacterium lianum TaxID=388280 RepID=A0A1M7NI81_9BACT|nr:hypothetical protein [Cyclobacterium lianum]SHN03517.1 hypothetical protein SAMN04488057_105351 [Cyclobacterium lianum]